MKIYFFIIIFVNLSCSTTKTYEELNHYGNIKGVKFISNYDGDTITVDIPSMHALIGSKISVRLYGIDAPEFGWRASNECEKIKGNEAKEFVYKTLKDAKNITLKEVQRDKYFRILAKVYADGTDLSQMLIEKGLAIPYFGGKKEEKNWCNSNKLK
jgi:micrococcal nuclease